jgi:hypothetical protein
VDSLAVINSIGRTRRTRRPRTPKRARYYWRVVFGPNWCRYGRTFAKSDTVRTVLDTLESKYPHARRVEVTTHPF